LNSKPRSLGPPFSINPSTKIQQSISLVLILERKEKNREKESHGRERGARPGGVGVLMVPGTGREERGEGYLTH